MIPGMLFAKAHSTQFYSLFFPMNLVSIISWFNSNSFNVSHYIKQPVLGYRTGHVRVIFHLPNHLCRFYPHQLVYIELFTPFNFKPISSHGLHTTSPALDAGKRCAAVIPLTDVVLTCHLAPHYSFLPKDILLDFFSDLLSVGRRFFLNHYMCCKLHQDPQFIFDFPHFFPKTICTGSKPHDPSAYPCRVAALVSTKPPEFSLSSFYLYCTAPSILPDPYPSHSFLMLRFYGLISVSYNVCFFSCHVV
jgi:hypothetical protein